jgi:hypothetical protein
MSSKRMRMLAVTTWQQEDAEDTEEALQARLARGSCSCRHAGALNTCSMGARTAALRCTQQSGQWLESPWTRRRTKKKTIFSR